METFGEALRRLRSDMSTRELARRANCSKSYVSGLENNPEIRPSAQVVAALDEALNAQGALIALHKSLDLAQYGDVETDVRRREFVGLTGAALFTAVVGTAPKPDGTTASIEQLAAALTEYTVDQAAPTPSALASAVTEAKSRYQACQYAEVLAMLPALLRMAKVACATMTGDDRLRAHALSAEAHHVAASALLKHDVKGLTWLAADRSVQAARASESPLMVGSSTRIITHALMDGGHHKAAADTASTAAARMQTTVSTPTPDDLSVYGSLLLRGATAAARHGSRHTTAELLDEAEQAGRRLGHEGNHMWTAFGPNNVLCHRVHTSLAFGDAGTAIEYARQVNIDALPINERKATLLLDTSRAFLMWGKHDKALDVLRAAGEIAPEEITGRQATLSLVRDIVATAPVGIRREAREYAHSLGVTA
ncbi:helix-turn-helix domain-containing protein [Herbidospora sp. NEAU-GS84]|uniref:Helix-turn-helix domain-containing protein n=1 Tax=Herbidospora solisilvae TaxID=2696284 RepID=A0A7C9J4Y4_9ACTN|nr:helix-turn-helix transcriptional regulator [Herbidospora solisilvae]NAS24605.1 helix-turn-helix domain-containing protein [Herbidospora solisilvae]